MNPDVPGPEMFQQIIAGLEAQLTWWQAMAAAVWPPSISFTPDGPITINAGDSAKIAYAIQNATLTRIDGPDGPIDLSTLSQPIGSLTVTPLANATYTFTAVNPAGLSFSASVSVTVAPAPVSVPDVVGKSFTDAATALVAAGLVIAPATVSDPTLAIATESPVAGTQAASGSTVTVTQVASPTPAPTPTPLPSNGFLFDFGTPTSPVMAGYIGISHLTKYAAAPGFGWASGTIDSRDRGATSDDLVRDFCFTADGVFRVDLPNGKYTVTIAIGDASYPHDQQGIFLQGQQMDVITTAAKEVATKVYSGVDVSDGKLLVGLKDMGGTDKAVCVQSMVVAPMA